eukprot:227776_1
MSKRKGTEIYQEPKRHKSNDYSGGGGGFTENVIDENNSAIIIDDDGMDINENDNENDTENWVIIDYEGQTFRVPLTDSIVTFGDIKRYLLSLQQSHIGTIEITSSHYIVDLLTDTEYIDDDDAMIANHKKLLIRWQCFFIKIMDGDFREDIRVAEDFTIQRIKEQVEKDRNIRLDQLSKDGLELQNDKTLREYNIFDNGHTLISRICIQITDQLCDLYIDILVCEFWSI